MDGILVIVSVLLLLTIGVGLALVVGWNARPGASDQRWIAAGLGGMFKDIAGTLAGFTITAATFLGTLNQDKDAPALAAAVGLLLLSFLILLCTAMLYSSMPAVQDDDPAVDGSQSLIDLLANAAYFIGAALGWVALRPLLQLIGLPGVADMFTWLLLITAVAGSARLAALTYRLSTANLPACLGIPLLGFGLPILFWLIASRTTPELLPGSNDVLQVAAIAFVVSIVALALQTIILMAHSHAVLNQHTLALGHRLAIATSQAAVLIIAATWLAVASS
jgi:hypothetical protein